MASDPSSGTTPVGHRVLNVSTGNLKRHTRGYVWDIPDVDADTHTLADVSDAGLDVPVSGDAAAGQVVKGDDSRLTDDRNPTAHTRTSSPM